MITKNEDWTFTETTEVSRKITLDELIQKANELKDRAENLKRERELQDASIAEETELLDEQITSITSL